MAKPLIRTNLLYKLRWLSALEAFVKAEMAQHPQLVLVGEFNVAPEDRELV